jgi:cold shock CspA family protein
MDFMTTKENARQLGLLHRFYAAKGFGFLRATTTNYKGERVAVNDPKIKDTFVHITQAHRDGIDDLAEGDVLEFDTGVDRRTGKPAAINLVRLQNGQAG